MNKNMNKQKLKKNLETNQSLMPLNKPNKSEAKDETEVKDYSLKLDLVVIKAKRVKQRIITIRKIVFIICIILLYWYSGNIMAFIYHIILDHFSPLVDITGLVFNMTGLISLFIFERSF